MNTKEALAHYDRELRKEIAYPDMRRYDLPNLVRFVHHEPRMSFVLYSDLDEHTADAAIDAEIAFFRELGQSFVWKVYDHDQPADLVQRLEAKGFAVEDHDAIMAIELGDPKNAWPAASAADVRRLMDPSQLGDVVGILEAVWDEKFDWVYEQMGGDMARPGYISIFVAYVDDVPACAGWTYYYEGQFAGLWGGSTLEEYRGRGLYSAVLLARMREAKERGVRYLTIDAGPMSRPIVERHGFQQIAGATECIWSPKDGASEESQT